MIFFFQLLVRKGVMTENKYQALLIDRLNELFPGCVIVKNDSSYQQGIPDLTVFLGPKWACLEVKASRRARVQPNQEWFVEYLDSMSFCAFIYPENEEEVLRELQQALAPGRRARIPQS